MVNIVICDDESRVVRNLKERITSVMSTTGESFRCISEITSQYVEKEIYEVKCDMIFLDIDMPGVNGFDVAESLLKLPRPPILIFVTNYESHIFESYKFKPFAFVRKCDIEQDLERVILNAYSYWKGHNLSIHIKLDKNEILDVPLSQIIYFKSNRNYLDVVTEEKTYRYRRTIDSLQQQLQTLDTSVRFIRNHRSYLTNMEYAVPIKKKDAFGVKIKNEIIILPLAKGAKEDLISYFYELQV